MARAVVLTGLSLIFAPLTSFAATYIVRPDGTGDFPTIQAAIDAVTDGDTIELSDGTFTGDGNRDLDFRGKAIVVCSQARDPERCIVDCEGSEADPHRGFIFQSNEPPLATLREVTITNGWGGFSQYGGSGIFCQEGAAPTICGCVIRECCAYSNGGGLYCLRAHPLVSGCVFSGNRAANGGAVRCIESAVEFLGCIFLDNHAANHGGALATGAESVALRACLLVGNTAGWNGGAVAAGQGVIELSDCTLAGNVSQIDGGVLCCSFTTAAHLEQCTFYGNTAADGGGGIASILSATVALTNSIIAGSTSGAAIACQGGGTASLACCDLYGNEGGDWVGAIAGQYGVDGNISEDPCFCNPSGDDLRLQEGSPCAPFTPPNEECDLIGAWPVGCGGTPVTEISWGAIKELFR